MGPLNPARKSLVIYCLSLLILLGFATWIRGISPEAEWQRTGLLNFSLGFMLLAAYAAARLLRITRLPMISGYIFSGIIAGPHVTGFLDAEMVGRLRLIDDLALSFIAMTAGGALHMRFLRARGRAIALNITLLTVLVFGAVFTFTVLAAPWFYLTRHFSNAEIVVFAMLLGVIAIARSPSSAIAIISECRAAGPFTETVLGVTVAMDVLIIILFTIALTVLQVLLAPDALVSYQVFLALCFDITASVLLGVVLGGGIALYIRRSGHDLPLFLLFLAFGVTKSCVFVNTCMEETFHIHLNLEPLLICVSTGFTVQNLSQTGGVFMESLERMSLPIYLLFFCMAGAALDLEALRLCWPLAVCLALVRGGGIFGATWLAGTLNGDPVSYRRHAWMAYLTQAGVAIGLAQMAQRHAPEIGVYLTTVVLAVITVNQIMGPITFKIALSLVGEAGKG